MEETVFVNHIVNILGSYSNNMFKFRLLDKDDYDKKYFDLLQQLTVAEKPAKNNWEIQFSNMSNNQKVVVIEDLNKKVVVGSITLLVEHKFIRSLGTVCHVEDFVIDKDYRSQGFGGKYLEIVDKVSKLYNCYKVILDCSDQVKGFYEKKGYSQKSCGMAKYL